MGSLFKSGASAPIQTYATYRDEVNGVEMVPVVADGKVTYVTRKIEKSAAEQEQQAKLQDIQQQALDKMVALSSEGTLDDNVLASLNNWEEASLKTVANTYAERAQEEEAELARRGIADSSAAQSVRRERRLDEQASQETVANKKSDLANQIVNEQLSLQQTLYALASQGLADGAASTAATAALNKAASSGSQLQSSLLDYYSQQNKTDSSLFSDVIGVATQALGSALGSGGSFGGSGSSIGSWKW